MKSKNNNTFLYIFLTIFVLLIVSISVYMVYYVDNTKYIENKKNYGMELSFLLLVIFLCIFYIFYEQYNYNGVMNYYLFFTLTILFFFILFELYILQKSYKENKKFEYYDRKEMLYFLYKNFMSGFFQKY